MFNRKNNAIVTIEPLAGRGRGHGPCVAEPASQTRTLKILIQDDGRGDRAQGDAALSLPPGTVTVVPRQRYEMSAWQTSGVIKSRKRAKRVGVYGLPPTSRIGVGIPGDAPPDLSFGTNADKTGIENKQLRDGKAAMPNPIWRPGNDNSAAPAARRRRLRNPAALALASACSRESLLRQLLPDRYVPR